MHHFYSRLIKNFVHDLNIPTALMEKPALASLSHLDVPEPLKPAGAMRYDRGLGRRNLLLPARGPTKRGCRLYRGR